MLEEMQYEQQALSDMQAMSRLLNNEDFVKLFTDGYLKEDLIFLGLNLVNNTIESRVKTTEQVIARGIFKQYIDGIITSGIQAQEAINEAAQADKGDWE
jgi:hypothetical protein